MVAIVADPLLEERLRAERRRTGADHHDEVWEGVYVMNPLPDNEHQQLVHRLEMVLGAILEPEGLGDVFPGVNLTDREDDWRLDFRGPDVTVFLENTKAENRRTHWRGPADLVVEIVSLNDRTREKIPFYSRLGVRELIIIDRDPWSLELFRFEDGGLQLVGKASPNTQTELRSEVVRLDFQLVDAQPRPSIEITHVESGRRWSV